MKTDSLFYQLFQILPGTLFELIGQSADNARGYEFASVEIKQPTFRIDGLFKPTVDSPDGTIYFQEAQIQRDDGFYWRLFAEIFLCLEQERPAANWLAVVLFPTRAADPGIPQQFAELTPRLTVLYLDDLQKTQDGSAGLEILKLIVESAGKARKRGKRLLKRFREEPGTLQENRRIIELVETVLVYKFPKMTREEFEAMYQLQDLKKTVIYQEALQEGRLEGEREGKLKGKRQGKREGKLEGKREGKLEGKREGKLEAVPLLVRSGLSVETIAKDLGLDVDAVRNAAQEEGKEAK